MPAASLRGCRVALLEARRESELANLVRRFGGVPESVPAVKEVRRDASGQVAALLDRWPADWDPVVIFLTGAGVDALGDEATAIGRSEELIARLNAATIVCRGPKPVAAARRRGIPAGVPVAEPHTTAEVVAALAPLPIAGRPVVLVHYGERNQALAEELQARRAARIDLCLYEWRLPDDLGPLRSLIGDLLAGRIAALACTSQVQVRHLFRVAAEDGRAAELADALNTRVLVGAIGPTCAAALREHGVNDPVLPEHAKMGHLVKALAAAVEATRGNE